VASSTASPIARPEQYKILLKFSNISVHEDQAMISDEYCVMWSFGPLKTFKDRQHGWWVGSALDLLCVEDGQTASTELMSNPRWFDLPNLSSQNDMVIYF
jgi:hypothetical protein